MIAYSSFRDTNPPPADSRFAKGSNGLAAACSNPANLKGGPGQPAAYALVALQVALRTTASPRR